ncbi:MAG: hypothetical protein R3E08_10770 [Thiotrichaceae bacterium]
MKLSPKAIHLVYEFIEKAIVPPVIPTTVSDISANTTNVDLFVEEMATQHDFDRAYVANLLKQSKVKKSILKVMNRSS